MTHSIFYLFILLFLLPVPADGQLFPYDKIHEEGLVAEEQLKLIAFNKHLYFFGSDTVNLEIYFDPTVEVPAPGGWALQMKCVETWFLEKKKLSGPIRYPISQVGHYQFITYKDGCFVNQYFNLLPTDHPSDQGIQVWGNCRPKPKESKL
jgi:hypothetical protein